MWTILDRVAFHIGNNVMFSCEISPESSQFMDVLVELRKVSVFFIGHIIRIFYKRPRCCTYVSRKRFSLFYTLCDIHVDVKIYLQFNILQVYFYNISYNSHCMSVLCVQFIRGHRQINFVWPMQIYTAKGEGDS